MRIRLNVTGREAPLISLHRQFLRRKTYHRLPNGPNHSGVELYDDSERKFRDFIDPNRYDLLNLTLSPCLLPLAKRPGSTSSLLPPGYHFLFFPTSRSELDTLEDGYERHFTPTHSFTRRVWTQGRLEFNGNLEIGRWAECVEELSKVVQHENATDVWVERKMYKDGSEEPKEWNVKELRCLRYLRNFPAARENSSQSERLPSGSRDTILIHTFTPSKILLTRFSYLTYNFHKIHVDTEYAQKVERHPDVLVHGSLSVTLIFAILHQFYESQNKEFVVKLAKYVMYRPLYVDNPVTLTVTSTNSDGYRALLWTNRHQKAVECVISPLK